LLPSRPRSSPSSAELRHLARPHFTGHFLFPRATASTAWAATATQAVARRVRLLPRFDAAAWLELELRSLLLAWPRRQRPPPRGACGGGGRRGLQRALRRMGSLATSLRRRGGGSRTVLPGGSRRRGEVGCGGGGGGGGARRRRDLAMAHASHESGPVSTPGPLLERAAQIPQRGGAAAAAGRPERRVRGKRGGAALRGATAAGGGLGQQQRGADRGEEGLASCRPLVAGWTATIFFDDVA